MGVVIWNLYQFTKGDINHTAWVKAPINILVNI